MGASNRSQIPTAAGTALSYRCRGRYAKIPIPRGLAVVQPQMQTIL